MQSAPLAPFLSASPLLNPRPTTRLGLLLDALQPTPGQSVGGTTAADPTDAVAGGAPHAHAPALPVEGPGPARFSETGLLLAQMGLKPRSPLELMLRFAAPSAGEGDAEVSPGAGEVAGTAAPRALADVDSRHLAQQLRNVVNRSGLFYESHVHEWAQGRRSLADLQKEPQHRWHASQGEAPANDEAFGPGTLPLAPREAIRQAPADRTDGPAANDPAYAGQTRRMVPPALEDLVARQLEVLDTRQLHLHLLPGQGAPVSLLIAQESEPDTPVALQAWVTEIECTLPELGTVHARLRLLGDQLAVSVHAADATRADWLDAQLGELRALLERSGLSPAVLEIRHEP